MKKWIFGWTLLGVMAAHSAWAQDDLEAMTSSQMLHEAQAAVTQIESAIKNSENTLDDARKNADVQQMDCVNASLVNLRGFSNVIKNSASNLKDAIDRNDITSAQHHFKLVQLASNKSAEVAAHAQSCSNGAVAVSGSMVSTTNRQCSVEPCLEGEEYFDPVKIESKANLYRDALDVDASAYL